LLWHNQGDYGDLCFLCSVSLAFGDYGSEIEIVFINRKTKNNNNKKEIIIIIKNTQKKYYHANVSFIRLSIMLVFMSYTTVLDTTLILDT
jgi:hypothetical protein